MTFAEIVYQHAEKVKNMKDIVKNEEATKTALILPFFQNVLDYDIFNPEEFVPEDNAVIDKSKWGSVDYVIYINEKPTIIIETKHVDIILDNFTQQLFKYFVSSEAKYAILTNGIEYRFYTDLEKSNKMDLKPFLIFDFLNIKNEHIKALERFCKKEYDSEKIFNMATEMKFLNEIKTIFKKQLSNPSDDFIRILISDSHEGTKTKAVVEKFKPFVKDAINDYINEIINERISSALIHTLKTDDIKSENGIEVEAVEIVKSILPEEFRRNCVNKSVSKNYFSINYRNCQMFLCHYGFDANTAIDIQFIQPFMEDGCKWNKREKREIFSITSINDIRLYSDRIISAAKDINESYMKLRNVKTNK